MNVSAPNFPQLSGPLRSGPTRRNVLIGAGALAGATALGLTGIGRAAAADPVRGGRLRVAMLGEPPSSALNNPWGWNSVLGLARLVQVLEKLTEYDAKNGQAVPQLATSWEPKGNSADTWVVKLRQGVTFHNGKTFNADDVVYSFQQILNPETQSSPRALLSTVLEPTGITKVNDYEVEFKLTKPYATFGNILSANMFIVPAGSAVAAEAPYFIGTGPFIIKSYKPAELTVFVRNENYWDNPRPYLDELHFLSVADESARINALLAKQVDVAHNMSAATIRTLDSYPDVKPFVSDTAHSLELIMASRRPPFTDVRVRQAFRLVVDRQEMVNQAVSGYGVVGNDLMCPADPMFASDLPQRVQDIDKAKWLLKEAGMENMSVTLETAAITPGAAESAQIFARQAKLAGIDVKVNNSTPDNYFSATGPFQNAPFFSSEDGDFTIDQCYALFYSTGGSYNATQAAAQDMPYTENWDKMIVEANSTLDDTKRRELWHEIQSIEYENGGLILPLFAKPLDAIASNVQGLTSHWRRELGFFQFENVWLSA
jgi:peptide/nickel transport system substrate-binding protein